MPPAPLVLAAIVNYNRADLTLSTVASLALQDGGVPREVMVVDNASSPSDLSALKAGLPANVRLVEMDENRGYGAAGNVALGEAIDRAIPFVWLLNNDLGLEPGCLQALVRAIRGDERLAACAPVVVEFDRPDVILSSGVDVGLLRGTSVHRRWGMPVTTLPADAEVVDSLEASAILIRTEAATSFGGFDESFFMYWEDVDWCLRARRAGWAVASVPTARVRHRLSQSSTPLDRIAYMIRNRIRVVRIHGSMVGQAAFMTYMTCGWLPAYALARLLPRFGLKRAIATALGAVAWNLRDARRRGHWRLTTADQRIGPGGRYAGEAPSSA